MIKNNSFQQYFFACLFFVLPIVIANAYYIDDLGRATSGYTGWGHDGRPMADVIMIALNLGKRLTDLAPLPLLISAALLAWCFDRFQRTFIRGRGLMAFLAPLAFLCNPFLVEVVSYRFDSLTIIAGVAFCFLSLMTGGYGRLKRNLLAVLAMLAAIASYQILLNVLIALFLIEFICQVAWSRLASGILKSAGERLCQLAATLGMYFFIVLPLSLHKQEVENHPGVATGNLLDTLINNAHAYGGFMRAALFGDATPIIFAAFTAIMLLGSVYLALCYLREHGRGFAQWFIALLCAISPLAAVLVILGALLFLNNAIATFSRVYIGLSGYLLYFSTLVYLVAKKTGLRHLNIVSLIPLLYAFPFIYSYGNALRQQNILDHDLVLSIKQNTVEYNENEFYIVFNGDRRVSAVMQNSAKKYPLINTLVVNYFANWYFPFRYMQINGLEQRYPLPGLGITANPGETLCASRLLTKTTDYNLYLKGDILTVDFARHECR
ncbi:glucosyltransferase domain-containing protein [Sodalis sp. RH21]|uniref:glucosyltransferase domain-containing protein n=1 Tax=unclassified Sodalis (in: enterobacteria) TaxID=2636512 RepID=UPI0039B55B33